MCRLTRKPRLFGSNACRIASASTVLLALASHFANAQDVPAGNTQPQGDDASPASIAASPARLQKGAGPLGWTAAGALLALALCPVGAMRATEEA